MFGLAVIARSASDEAIHSSLWRHGLLRFARNDGLKNACAMLFEKQIRRDPSRRAVASSFETRRKTPLLEDEDRKPSW
jgi:hypothetical protein